MGWRAASDGKATGRGDSGCGVDYGMQDDSGAGPHADKANLRTVRVPDAGGLPAWARVFYGQRGIGKRSAPGVSGPLSVWDETRSRGSVRRRRIGPGRRDAHSSPTRMPRPSRSLATPTRTPNGQLRLAQSRRRLRSAAGPASGGAGSVMRVSTGAYGLEVPGKRAVGRFHDDRSSNICVTYKGIGIL